MSVQVHTAQSKNVHDYNQRSGGFVHVCRWAGRLDPFIPLSSIYCSPGGEQDGDRDKQTGSNDTLTVGEGYTVWKIKLKKYQIRKRKKTPFSQKPVYVSKQLLHRKYAYFSDTQAKKI